MPFKDIITIGKKTCLQDDSMKGLDDDEHRIMIEALALRGKPMESSILKNARVEGTKIVFDLDLDIDHDIDPVVTN